MFQVQVRELVNKLVESWFVSTREQTGNTMDKSFRSPTTFPSDTSLTHAKALAKLPHSGHSQGLVLKDFFSASCEVTELQRQLREIVENMDFIIGAG